MSNHLPRSNIEVLFKIATTAESRATRARARDIIEDEANQQNGIIALLSERALSVETYLAGESYLIKGHRPEGT